jgi:hypothetical protein
MNVQPFPYRAHFARYSDTIEGEFTLFGPGDVRLLDRVLTRSGQRGWTHTHWERGKSPIPPGVYRLWMTPYNKGQKPGARGVGEFYPISTGDNKSLIVHPLAKLQRVGIGDHDENLIPGSAGCTVTVKDPDWERKRAIYAEIRKQGIQWIPLNVHYTDRSKGSHYARDSKSTV